MEVRGKEGEEDRSGGSWVYSVIRNDVSEKGLSWE